MKRLLLILSISAGLTITGCGSDDSGHTHGEDTHTHETEQHAHGEGTEAAHQHEGEEGHDHSEAEEEHSHSGSGEDAHSHEGETSEAMMGLDENYEQVRKGIRLTLSYDSDSKSFNGTIENTTQDVLPAVSVKVELSNGSELGPTSPVDLAAGETHSVELGAGGEPFNSWSAHSEIGRSGHSHGEDDDHEHPN
ncbi:hypothetical protein [Fodinibius sediminis]|uniref:Uncharacterized protein n=1 Tax=Fodinibius sediminis TaxID=1214077 RepID=A0A521BQ37_9BACT|nr:hypothetical protein [Fodinibius sediminis]SMO49257.1 hypothetical protein SAMN06265218_103301 [Fodinibius sediminis]